jgi:hypothetical protein
VTVLSLPDVQPVIVLFGSDLVAFTSSPKARRMEVMNQGFDEARRTRAAPPGLVASTAHTSFTGW